MSAARSCCHVVPKQLQHKLADESFANSTALIPTSEIRDPRAKDLHHGALVLSPAIQVCLDLDRLTARGVVIIREENQGKGRN